MSKDRSPIGKDESQARGLAGRNARFSNCCKSPRSGVPIQRARYATRRRPPFEQAVKGLVFFSGPPAPAYTQNPVKAWAGGSNSSADLGPAIPWIDTRSDADSNKPQAIGRARREHPDKSFKAGHLLNAKLGGSGKDAKNLTILSASGNANHKAFDNPVIRAMTHLKTAYKLLHDDGIVISSVGMGIRVQVLVDTGRPWGDDYPDNCIFKRLNCTATLINEKDTAEFEKAGNANYYSSYVSAIKEELKSANDNGTIKNK